MGRSRAARRVGSAFELAEPVLNPLSTQLLAIDPGISHCGMAWFERGDAWEVAQLEDMPPIDCVLAVRKWIDFIAAADPIEGLSGVLVVEGFQLYPGKLQEQGFSRMGTPEVIGAIKWVYLDECWVGRKARDKPKVSVAMFEQGASIKQHGQRYMDDNGIPAQGSNQHKRDAEMHGWYRIKSLEALRRKEEARAD